MKNIQVGTLLPSTVQEGNPQKVDTVLQELGQQCFTVRTFHFMHKLWRSALTCQNSLIIYKGYNWIDGQKFMLVNQRFLTQL